MGPLQNLAIVLACWVIGEVASLDPWDYVWGHYNTPAPARQPYMPSGVETYPYAWVDASQARALSLLSPVLVQCGEAQVMVTVKRDLFGTGRLVQVEGLSLGPSGCQPTTYNAAENTVIFNVGLHECGSVLQVRVGESANPCFSHAKKFPLYVASTKSTSGLLLHLPGLIFPSFL